MKTDAVKDKWAAELERLAELVEAIGLDGLLAMVIAACHAREERADDDATRALWHNRAYNCRAYKQMAKRVEGRED